MPMISSEVPCPALNRTRPTHPLLLGSLGLPVLEVLAVRLEGADDVELRSVAAPTGTDRAAVDHQSGTVEPAKCHERARHVLVAAGDDDHAVEPVAAGGRLDLVGDQVARLKLQGARSGIMKQQVSKSD